MRQKKAAATRACAEVETFTALIYVGLRNRDDGQVYKIMKARQWLQKYVNRESACVTITPTEFLYKNGREPGFVVGLINYPRFPESPTKIRKKAQAIARGLRKLLKQYRVSTVFPDKTVMVSKAGVA